MKEMPIYVIFYKSNNVLFILAVEWNGQRIEQSPCGLFPFSITNSAPLKKGHQTRPHVETEYWAFSDFSLAASLYTSSNAPQKQPIPKPHCY